jgi:hypothetical protein
MLVRVDRSDYLTTCARIRGIAPAALVRRLIRIIGNDQLVASILDDTDDIKRHPKASIAIKRRDMGEVIGFKRKKPFIPEQVPPPINLAEPITADKFPAWGQGNDAAPSEYCAPESDGA